MDRLLDDSKRLMLAWSGRTVPLLAPMAFWWDGKHIWFSTAGASVKAWALRRDGTCAMYVPPLDDGQAGLLLRGTARVFGIDDPLGLALHGGFLAAAQTALMVKNAPEMLGYVVDAPRIPQAFLPTNRVLIRVTVESDEAILPPPIGHGIAPALPTEVPPEIRRILAGQRRIVIATQVDGGLGLMPAVWGAGFSLDVPAGAGLSDRTTATVVVDRDPGFRPTKVVGVSITGAVAVADGSDGRLDPAKVRWWSGFDVQTTELSGQPTDTVVIPD